MNKQIILIIIIIILIFLLMPIRIQVIRNNELDKKGRRKNDINLYFFKLLSLRFDLDKFISKIIKIKEQNTMDMIKKNINFIKKNKIYLKTFLSIIPIEKITIIYQSSNPFVSVCFWNSIYIIRNIMIDLFEVVNNEYYNVQMEKEFKTNVKFEFVCTIRMFYFLYALVINIIRKIRKGSVFYGKPSNKRFISNFDG